MPFLTSVLHCFSSFSSGLTLRIIFFLTAALPPRYSLLLSPLPSFFTSVLHFFFSPLLCIDVFFRPSFSTIPSRFSRFCIRFFILSPASGFLSLTLPLHLSSLSLFLFLSYFFHLSLHFLLAFLHTFMSSDLSFLPSLSLFFPFLPPRIILPNFLFLSDVCVFFYLPWPPRVLAVPSLPYAITSSLALLLFLAPSPLRRSASPSNTRSVVY